MHDPSSKLQLILANERTFAAWIRTGLAFLAAGYAFWRFIGIDYGSLGTFLACLLIFFSAVCFIASSLHFLHVEMKVAAKESTGLPHYLLFGFSFVMVCLSLVAMVLIFFGGASS